MKESDLTGTQTALLFGLVCLAAGVVTGLILKKLSPKPEVRVIEFKGQHPFDY